MTTDYKWRGSTDPADKSGVATLHFTDSEGCKCSHEIRLSCFADLQSINRYAESMAQDHTRHVKRKLLTMANELEI